MDHRHFTRRTCRCVNGTDFVYQPSILSIRTVLVLSCPRMLLFSLTQSMLPFCVCAHVQAARESSCLDLSNVSLPAGWQDVPVNGPFTMHNRPTSIGTGPLLSADCSAAAGTSLALDSTLVMHGRGDSLLLQSGMSSLQCLSFMHTQDWQTDSQPGMQLLTAPDSTLMPAPCTMMGSFQQQQHTTLLPHQQQQYIQPSQLLLLPEQHQQQPPGLQPPPLQAASGSARLFFAGVCPLASSEEVLTLFAQFGRVMELNLYRPYKHCKTTKVGFGWGLDGLATLATMGRGE